MKHKDRSKNISLFAGCRWMLIFLCVPTIWAPSTWAAVEPPGDTISMDVYFLVLIEQHPVFQFEENRELIETEQRESYLGNKDWNVGADVNVAQFQAVQASDSPSEVDQFSVGIGLNRAVWQTGGRVALRWDQRHNQLNYPAWQSNFFLPSDRAYEQTVSLNYIHPLLRNRAGTLDRTDYEAAEFSVKLAGVFAREQEEQFLLSAGLAFINWTLLEEQLRIFDRRMQLSNEQISRIRKKRAANLVDKVDVLRAEDSRRNTEQARALTESRRDSQRRTLAELAAHPQLVVLKPTLALYQTQRLPMADSTKGFLKKASRTAISFTFQQNELARRKLSVADQNKADLSLILGVALKGGGDESQDSFDINKQDASIGLRFSKPFGNRQAKHQLQKVTLQLHDLTLQRQRALIDLQSQAVGLLTELKSMDALLHLNQEQIHSAKQTTAEEWQLYNQGRNDLATVILSQDREQLAQLTYAQNAASYQRLLLQLKALLDNLVLEPASDKNPRQSDLFSNSKTRFDIAAALVRGEQQIDGEQQ